ncbi:MAG: flagellar hook-basal body complex protein [Planctomycetes bacterium]|nr:flagellar hook-basal body complex protein [Planctomycetota bacterium]
MTSFFTSLSALKAHQDWIEVVGNNLANASTTGFKGSYATFSEQFSRVIRYGSAPSAGLGGTNPTQLGLGVRVTNVGRDLQQGAIATTGRVFDMAIEGRGFFVLNGGTNAMFTRVGTFGLDSSGTLVDQRTGLRVQGVGGAPIRVDANAQLAPRATSSVAISGNLPKVVQGPKPEILASPELRSGTQAVVQGTIAGPFNIPAGETWTMRVRVNGGSPQTVSVTSTSGTVTAAEVASAIDGLTGVSAEVDGAGNVILRSDDKGLGATLKIDPGVPGRDLSAAAGLSNAFTRGTEADVTPTTDLSELVANAVPYQDGDVIQISGVDADGTAISTSFVYGAANDGTTVQQFVDYLNGVFGASTVQLDADGRIVVTADQPGEAGVVLTLDDANTSIGRTDWSDYSFAVTQQGTDPDVVTTSAEVYDASGVAHVLTWSFERQADGTWTATASMPDGDGTVLTPPITGIRFADDGTPLGFSGLSNQVGVQFAGQSGQQTFRLDLGTDGSLSGLTQFGSAGDALVVNQDGYAAGNLNSVSVDQTGTLRGFFSNGRTESLGKLAMATFANAEGLTDLGNGIYVVGANSGDPVIGEAGLNGAGRIIGGALESSNVDTAEQFVRLIEAQRGYQANARVVSAQDEILRETVNMT